MGSRRVCGHGIWGGVFALTLAAGCSPPADPPSAMTGADVADFQSSISEADTVLVDFWAPWCGPCVQMAPEIAALKKDPPVEMDVVKINIDEDSETASRFGVSAIPHVFVLHDGRVVADQVGFTDQAGLRDLIRDSVD